MFGLPLVTRLHKLQLTALISVAIADFFLLIGTLTPAWQVAEDKDVGQYVQSGLWLYCPGAAQCWYIFSDNLINYYERVEVCRFLLIGDCRKKLLRTPYFFGWHYAVLILNMITMGLLGLAIISSAFLIFKKEKARIATIVFDIMICLAALVLSISLIVFMVNAEMLESKYLIGRKNTFEKEYGYSYYLTGLSWLIICFCMLVGVGLTTYQFFITPEDSISDAEPSYKMAENYGDGNYYNDQPKAWPDKQMSIPPRYPGGEASGFNTPMRSSTPMSQLPMLNANHGEYIPSMKSPHGEFEPSTRHFYSY